MSLKVHDLECTNAGCAHVELNAIVKNGHITRCPRCRHRRTITYPMHSGSYARTAAVHSSERAVVWMNRATGSVATPPVNNAPMPARYRDNGYERVEFDSLQSLDRFCKSRNLVNEAAHYDRSGHADDL